LKNGAPKNYLKIFHKSLIFPFTIDEKFDRIYTARQGSFLEKTAVNTGGNQGKKLSCGAKKHY